MANEREQRRKAREMFVRARGVERTYTRQLTAVGRQVGAIVEAFAGKDGLVPFSAFDDLRRTLSDYSKAIGPWANAVSNRMIAEVNRRDLVAWKTMSRQIGAGLERELNYHATGHAHAQLLREQVVLIKSIPLDAAERVHDLTRQALLTGERAASLSREIARQNTVSINKAKLIARTEVARTASILTQTRAEYVGSEGYIWRTSQDSDVRPEHKILEGRFIDWHKPPVAGSNGERAHAGQIYNCRCWPEPVLPDRVR